MSSAVVPAQQLCRVLLVVEDATFAELLADTLNEAGHPSRRVDGQAELERALASGAFEAAIVDFDTRARDGAELAARLRAQAPRTAIIALLPCGGLAPNETAPYHLAIEKPARLQAVLAAVARARRGFPD